MFSYMLVTDDGDEAINGNGESGELMDAWLQWNGEQVDVKISRQRLVTAMTKLGSVKSILRRFLTMNFF